MPAVSMARGTVRVTCPETHEVRPLGSPPPAHGSGRQAGPADPVHAALVDSLRDHGLGSVQRFQLTPQPSPSRVPEPTGPAALTVDVDLPGDQDAVVLLERDGCYSWERPAIRGQRRTAGRVPDQAHTAHVVPVANDGSPGLLAERRGVDAFGPRLLRAPVGPQLRRGGPAGVRVGRPSGSPRLRRGPNGGPNLADPLRWVDLADLLTNLTAASARALSPLPGGARPSLLWSRGRQGLAVFVRYLVSNARSPGGVPGLAAMVPGGAFITELNRTQPGQPPPGTP